LPVSGKSVLAAIRSAQFFQPRADPKVVLR
jgi:hypothetical protein